MRCYMPGHDSDVEVVVEDVVQPRDQAIPEAAASHNDKSQDDFNPIFQAIDQFLDNNLPEISDKVLNIEALVHEIASYLDYPLLRVSDFENKTKEALEIKPPKTIAHFQQLLWFRQNLNNLIITPEGEDAEEIRREKRLALQNKIDDALLKGLNSIEQIEAVLNGKIEAEVTRYKGLDLAGATIQSLEAIRKSAEKKYKEGFEPLEQMKNLLKDAFNDQNQQDQKLNALESQEVTVKDIYKADGFGTDFTKSKNAERNQAFYHFYSNAENIYEKNILIYADLIAATNTLCSSKELLEDLLKVINDPNSSGDDLLRIQQVILPIQGVIFKLNEDLQGNWEKNVLLSLQVLRMQSLLYALKKFDGILNTIEVALKSRFGDADYSDYFTKSDYMEAANQNVSLSLEKALAQGHVVLDILKQEQPQVLYSVFQLQTKIAKQLFPVALTEKQKKKLENEHNALNLEKVDGFDQNKVRMNRFKGIFEQLSKLENLNIENNAELNKLTEQFPQLLQAIEYCYFIKAVDGSEDDADRNILLGKIASHMQKFEAETAKLLSDEKHGLNENQKAYLSYLLASSRFMRTQLQLTFDDHLVSPLNPNQNNFVTWVDSYLDQYLHYLEQVDFSQLHGEKREYLFDSFSELAVFSSPESYHDIQDGEEAVNDKISEKSTSFFRAYARFEQSLGKDNARNNFISVANEGILKTVYTKKNLDSLNKAFRDLPQLAKLLGIKESDKAIDLNKILDTVLESKKIKPQHKELAKCLRGYLFGERTSFEMYLAMRKLERKILDPEASPLSYYFYHRLFNTKTYKDYKFLRDAKRVFYNDVLQNSSVKTIYQELSMAVLKPKEEEVKKLDAGNWFTRRFGFNTDRNCATQAFKKYYMFGKSREDDYKNNQLQENDKKDLLDAGIKATYAGQRIGKLK